MNKKGGSLSLWNEGILLSILAVMMIGVAVAGFNSWYGEDHQVGLGTETTMNEFIDYQDTLSEEIKGGEADFDSSAGLTLKSSWGILKSIVTIMWNFITGGWIETLILYMKLPLAVAVIFRVLWFLAFGYIILKILFKVNV
jgi:hypothetical protein